MEQDPTPNQSAAGADDRRDPFRVVWPVRPPEKPTENKEPTLSYEETPVGFPADVLLRHNARVLDPTTALQPSASRRRLHNRRLDPTEQLRSIPYQPTAYVAEEILVRTTGRGAQEVLARVEELSGLLAKSTRLRTRSLALRVANRAELKLADARARTRTPGVVRLTIESQSEEAVPPTDAWDVLQTLRDQLGKDTEEVGLNHLMFAATIEGVGGGFTYGHAVEGVGGGFTYGHSAGAGEYAIPGLGGRSPVRWLGRPPLRKSIDRRPVVAVIDSGVARHPWFPNDPTDPIVLRFRYDEVSAQVEPADELTGGEPNPNLIDPLEGLLDPFFGHGTFVAGLVNQTCPDARVLSIKAMGTDGVVDEAALINSLSFLHQRQLAAQDPNGSGPDNLVDILSLSLGYYHESDPDGIEMDTLLEQVLDALSGAGVMVIAAAGNNATSRPLLPAGFTAYRNGVLGGGGPAIPLLSVGALNPDGSVALFSNSGDWVACHCPGAALVSTLPIADVGQRSGVDLGLVPPTLRTTGTWRATIDPDSFTGFGTWSGTSFATPVMAGAAAQALVDAGGLDDVNGGVGRAQAAMNSLGFSTTVA
jgi:hypothetical protein